MKYTGTTFRPPVEHDSLLLQVTVGCAHNECTFCSMYRDVDFEIESLQQIESDLKKAKKMYRDVKRVFLLNGDAFVLSARRLKDIAKLIIEYFPEVEVITMYASVQNIKDKTDEELRELKEDYRIDDLYVGLETGHPQALESIKKGHTVEDAVRELNRLNNAGIKHISLLMLGTAGHGQGMIAAKHTADLLNSISPKAIWFGTLAIYPGSDLDSEVKDNIFTPATELEILNEEKELLRLIDLKEATPLYGVHPTNVASIQGIMPRDREKMIEEIDRTIEQFGEEALNKSLDRFSL